jgi:hypothetical protein
MLSQFDINHIKGAFDMVESDLSTTGKLTERTKQQIAYARKLIKHAEEQKFREMSANYAAAIGTKPSPGLMNRIAADCERYGSD